MYDACPHIYTERARIAAHTLTLTQPVECGSFNSLDHYAMHKHRSGIARRQTHTHSRTLTLTHMHVQNTYSDQLCETFGRPNSTNTKATRNWFAPSATSSGAHFSSTMCPAIDPVGGSGDGETETSHTDVCVSCCVNFCGMCRVAFACERDRRATISHRCDCCWERTACEHSEPRARE